MSRNNSAHFRNVPRMNHQRSVFDRSFSHSTTAQIGEVFPILTEEILPGDSCDISTSKVVRLQTLLTPVMGDMYLDTYFFFCPNRILWDHWTEFMGENTASAWIPQIEYKMPRVSSPDAGFAPGTIADYMGMPVNIRWSASDPGAPSALPFRAYAMIMDRFFKDQNVENPPVISTGDDNVVGSNQQGNQFYERGGKPFIACKLHDYFTSCLPSPQRGPSVMAPGTVRGRVPVIPEISHDFLLRDSLGRPVPESFGTVSGGTHTVLVNNNNSPILRSSRVEEVEDENVYVPSNNADVPLAPTNLWADFGVHHFSETDASFDFGIDINGLRLSVLTQMYYEQLARSGSRYEEQLQSFFGVTNPDGRMNHPEYLGGNRIRLNVTEVTNTAQTDADHLGDVGAKSATTDVHSDFFKSFTEHGWLIGVAVVRYAHVYSNGMPAKFTRHDKFSYYNPLFASIGEQPVYVRELFANANTLNSNQVFGFQEAWASYRTSNSMVSGLMRPGVTKSFGHWTLADNYASIPTLGYEWLREDRNNVDRVLTVTSSATTPPIFADFYFRFKHTRAMPMYSVPGALGAF